ncbi:MAG: enoyl-CoA hydratase-related protein [Pseudomonadota bacterium]
MTDFIRLQINGPIAELIFNKPERRNALCLSMWRAIPTLLTQAVDDPCVSVIIIHGGDAGCFAAGADISEFAEIYATAKHAAESSDILGAGVQAIERCSKPVVAAVEGACFGGGVSIAAACDLRFVAENSKFGVTPGKLGLLYSPADTRRLIRMVGLAHAKDLLFSGRIISFDEAKTMGIVDHHVPAGGALSAAHEWATTVATTAQSSVRATKAMITGLEAGWSDDEASARELFLKALSGEDFKEGYNAFLEKRPAQFPGNTPS